MATKKKVSKGSKGKGRWPNSKVKIVKKKFSAGQFKDAQQALLFFIIKNVGGQDAAGAACKKAGVKFDPHHFTNWKQRGGVGIEYLVRVARTLKVSPWALNYRGNINLSRDKPPAWAKVVSGVAKLTPEQKKVILKLKAPVLEKD